MGGKPDCGFFVTVGVTRTLDRKSSQILAKRFLFRKRRADLLVYPIGSFCHSRGRKLRCLASGNARIRLPSRSRCIRLQMGALLDHVQTIQVMGSTGDCCQPEHLHSVQFSLCRSLDGAVDASTELQVGPRLRSRNGGGEHRRLQHLWGSGNLPNVLESLLRLCSRRASGCA